MNAQDDALVGHVGIAHKFIRSKSKTHNTTPHLIFDRGLSTTVQQQHNRYGMYAEGELAEPAATAASTASTRHPRTPISGTRLRCTAQVRRSLVDSCQRIPLEFINESESVSYFITFLKLTKNTQNCKLVKSQRRQSRNGRATVRPRGVFALGVETPRNHITEQQKGLHACLNRR